MVTIPTSVTASPSRFRRSRLALYFLGALVLVLAGAVVWFYSVARSALAQVDGRVRAVGLAPPVTGVRKAHRAPTINAANCDDLFFAQGYVTAQDRLFQMDGMRRFAAGELAEVFGSDYLEHDRQQRILG